MTLNRASKFKELDTTQFDVAIIGGGINGAGLARELALRGIKTVLFEKGDFASGTSSASSKLIHGGFRYLENLEFKLVFESLKERALLLKNAPHLVKPLQFLIPSYTTDPIPRWKWKVGLTLYDLLSIGHRIGTHTKVNKDEALQLESCLQPKDLTSAFLYWDAQMDDARLCLECILQAEQWGATIFNYVKVQNLNVVADRVTSLKVEDMLTQTEQAVNAKVVVNAAGPWCDEVLAGAPINANQIVKPSQGIHLVTRQLSDHAMLIPSRSDHRIFFIIPWENQSLIGTTDTQFDGDPDQASPTQAEIEYLITQTNHILTTPISRADIHAVFVGLRPLVYQSKAHLAAISREHHFFNSLPNLISIVGGKYTTFRAVAESLARKVIRDHFKDKPFIGHTRAKPIFGANFTDWTTFQQTKIPEIETVARVSESVAIHLVKRYGSAVDKIAAMIRKTPGLNRQLPGTPFIAADVVYAIRAEFALHIEDFLRRRTALMLEPENGLQCLSEVGAIFAEELNWDNDRLTEETDRYRFAIEQMRKIINLKTDYILEK